MSWIKKQGKSEIIKVFVKKYKSLYTSVPTNDSELCEIYCEVDSLLPQYIKCDDYINPCIINTCILSLKKQKSDGNKMSILII